MSLIRLLRSTITVYTVIAAVTLARPEDDSDLHAVIQRGGGARRG